MSLKCYDLCMRRFIANIFFLLFLAGIAFYFRDPLLRTWSLLSARLNPCAQPIAYSIGEFDTRFGISKETFLKDLQKAESVWEKPIDKELFVYDPDGALKINLIYDDRQAATQKLQKLGFSIRDDQASYDALKVKYEALKKTINALKASYQTQSDAYDAKLSTYNKEVTYWNNRGGASQETVDRLAREKAALDQMRDELNALQGKINARVDELNALVEVINRLARSLNLVADQYNTIGASRGGEFEEGEYVRSIEGTRINIYQFDDQAKLIRVLMHEMGHALRLDHLENPKAIMYRLNNGVNAVLTADDVQALKTLCRVE